MSNIPCVLVNRDRLSTTRKLCEDLHVLGYTNIHIVDMNSSYYPLLEWYKSQTLANVIYIQENAGQQVLWKTGLMKKFSDHPFIAYSDSDVELNPNTPKGFIEQLIVIAKDFRINKVGLAIQIDDLPANPLCDLIRSIETNYWKHRIEYGKLELYDSPLDTTFSVVRTNLPFTYKAVRVGGDYTCKHIPWYTDFDNLSAEEEYFITHADPQVSTYAAHYHKLKAGQSLL